MKREKILIIIPAHNESANITKVLSDIKHEIKDTDVLVIDDCSTDNTKNIAVKHGAKCVSTIFNLGYAMAVQTGIKYAAQNNYNYVIQMDADGQHLASEAKKLYDKALATKADIVIGNRYFKGSAYRSPFFRKFGTNVFRGMVRLFCRQAISDPLSGLQCLNQRTIQYYAQPGNYPEYPDANLIIEMLSKGYKIAEVPVKMSRRTSGVSMHSGVLKPIKYMFTQFYACIVIFIKNVGKGKTHHE